jgi:hypothetical protein
MKEIKHSDYKSDMKATSREEIDSAINLKDRFFSIGSKEIVVKPYEYRNELDTNWYCVRKQTDGYVFRQNHGVHEIVINMNLEGFVPTNLRELIIPDKSIKSMISQ